MLIDSITLVSGASISNMTVADGTTFPADGSAGELFFKISDGLYLHDGVTWNRLLQVGEASGGSGASVWTEITGTPTTLAGYGITDAVATSTKGAVNGVASLDSSGKVPTAQLPTSTTSWSSITSKPTTVTGFGITDAVTTARINAVNGVAGLDGTGKVAASQLPSYVDDVLEYTNLAGFPATGETGKIYVAMDLSKIYRWTGSIYVEVIASPGTTDSVPEGTSNLYYTVNRANTAINNFASTGNVHSSSQLATARTISLTGVVAGSASFDGTSDITITTTGDIGGGTGGGGAASFYAQFSGAVAPTTGDSPYYPRNTITVTNIFASLSAPAATQVTARVNVSGVQKQIVIISAGQTTSTTVTNFAVQPTEYVTVDIVGGTGNNLSLRFDY